MILKQIGVIHTPYKNREDAPFQGRFSENDCEIEIFEEFVPGLNGVDTCTHLIVIYWLDKANRNSLKAFPPHDGKEHGVFATRSPNRPNPIGLGIVDLLKITDNIISVKGLDAVDGTPLLDIKPYSSDVDCIGGAKIGWQTSTK